jgi:eukaryotic-like serine/threonine-protein kinase
LGDTERPKSPKGSRIISAVDRSSLKSLQPGQSDLFGVTQLTQREALVFMEPTRRPATTLLSQGTILEDRYEILRICGRGGMSTVYVARDLRFHHVERLCAIKEMHVAAPDDRTRTLRIANFEQEAAMLATLSHQAIPKIFDFFADGGLVYLVLEYIEGDNLESIIDGATEPFPEDTLISWALQILEVLAYLHDHQPEPIVFRDMKPSNIMLRPDGKLSLIDFGIARTFQPLQKGTMIGTEGYAPPEQYRGVAEPRGDLYALGATLHHLATRTDPRTETPFTFDQRPARQSNPEISREFEEILSRALAYSAPDRFPSAHSMADALRALHRDESSGFHSPPPANQPMAGTGFTRETGNGTGWVTTESSESAPRPSTMMFDQTASSFPEQALPHVPLPDGTLPVRERIVWKFETGDEVRGSAFIAHRRAYIGSYDRHVYAITQSDGSNAWRFRCQRGVVARPIAAGDSIFVGSEDQNMYCLRASSGRMMWSFRAAMAIRSSGAVHGDYLVFGSDDSYCYCLNANDGQLQWRQRTWGPVRSSPSIYQDSVVIGSDDGALYRIEIGDGRVAWRTQLGDRILSSPAMESGVIVVGNADGAIYGLSFQSGKILWKVPTQRPVLSSPRVLGGVAYVGSTDGAIYAISVEDGAEIWQSRIANQVTSSVSIYSGYGYVGTIDGDVHCLNLRDGDTVWKHRIGGPVTSTPAVSDGIVILGSLDRRVYGLRM